MPPEAEYCIVERLFISSLVAFVTKDHRRKLYVYHFKKGTEICHYTYNDTILAVKLNRQVLDSFIEASYGALYALWLASYCNKLLRVHDYYSCVLPALCSFVASSLQRLVVVLKNQLYIHNIKDMKITHTIRDMPLNKAG